jgi:NADP-dependent 3-hydroxy acid dehydrogenase YdfG
MRKQVEYIALVPKDISDKRKKYRNTKPILKPEDIADGIVYVLFTPEHKEDFFFWIYVFCKSAC